MKMKVQALLLHKYLRIAHEVHHGELEEHHRLDFIYKREYKNIVVTISNDFHRKS